MAGSSWATPLRQLRDLFHQGTPAGSTDGQLLAKFAASGDPRAFEALVGRHGPMVAATCRAVLRNEHDAEDAFQATFLVLARKARSVRVGDALGPWLHRVAYRAAVQAIAQARRRQQEEAEAGLMAIQVRAGSGEADEARRLVHEEVDRLPDRHRLPVVLCDLEGLSYGEAATRLGLTEPALRTRLARGRERLRERLQGRGVSAGVVIATLARPFSAASRAVVPLSWSRAAVAAATGTAAPAGVVAITEALMRGMLMARIKLAGGVLLGASALVAAGVALAGPTAQPPPPAPAVVEARGQEARPEKKADEKERTIVRGIVLDPEGKPIAGASVQSVYENPTDASSMGTTDAEGRFVLRLKDPFRISGGLAMSLPAWLIASAPGFGLGIQDPDHRGDPDAEQVIRLVPEGEPIEGRVVDDEGRPVEGVQVRLGGLFGDPKRRDDPSPWIARMRSGTATSLHDELEQIMAPIWTSTGPDGRFKIDGLGRNRVALFSFHTPTTATTHAYTFTINEPEIRVQKPGLSPGAEFVIHSPRFEIAIGAARPIEGTVRDKDTGAPIAGATVLFTAIRPYVRATSFPIMALANADGHYNVPGLPVATTYDVVVHPPAGSPHLPAAYEFKPETTTGSLTYDPALMRGSVVRGRVVDATTGQPIRGAVQIASYEDQPGMGYVGSTYGAISQGDVDADGRFAVVTWPGPAVLYVSSQHHRRAHGYEKIRGYNAKTGMIISGDAGIEPDGVNAVVEVIAGPASEAEPLEIRLEPGRTVKIEVTDPEGRPIEGAQVRERMGLSYFQNLTLHRTQTEFEITGLDPSQPRRVVVRHEGRKLAGSVLLTGDEQGPIEVRLQPWGALAGRVVDDEGNPRANIRLQSPTDVRDLRSEDSDLLPVFERTTDAILEEEGRFRVEGLVPGLKYSAMARDGDSIEGYLFRDRVVGPGEVVDLGDLKLIDQDEGPSPTFEFNIMPLGNQP